MNCLLGVALLGSVAFYSINAVAQEMNISCKPDYALFDGRFDHDLPIENIYIRYEELRYNGKSPERYARIAEIDAPFECGIEDSFIIMNDKQLELICKTKKFMTNVTINRKTGKYKRFTQVMNSNPLRYEDVSGKCYRKGTLY